MSIGSPTAFLQWAILSCIFLAFLIVHLWCYDRFNCVRWDSGRRPGAFKRVMTYSYLATVPLLVVFSVSITALKFREGFLQTPTGQIIPVPLEFWHSNSKRWILPLYFVLSAAWALEIVTHLEELAFWLFLLHQGHGHREWFESWEYRTWYIGSMTSVLGVPLTTLIARNNLETCIAWIFLVGSSASTLTTILFLYVLGRFPSFIRSVKTGGAEPDVVVRLSIFYQLNLVRVVFRFLFTIPLLMVGLDGVQGPHVIIRNAFAADFLLMMGGIGCFVSSAITLLIFFPRSITNESGYKPKDPTIHIIDKQRVEATYTPTQHHRQSSSFQMPIVHRSPHSQTGRTALTTFRFPPTAAENPTDPVITVEFDDSEEARPLESIPHDPPWDPHGASTTYLNSHTPYPQNIHGKPPSPSPVAQLSLEAENNSTHLHPYVMTFVSPIDLPDPSGDDVSHMT